MHLVSVYIAWLADNYRHFVEVFPAKQWMGIGSQNLIVTWVEIYSLLFANDIKCVNQIFILGGKWRILSHRITLVNR